MSPEKDTASEHPWNPGVFRISVNPLTLSFCGDIGNLLGRYQYICFALALWNGKDPILKERLFGLTGSEVNHGEDVKEYFTNFC